MSVGQKSTTRRAAIREKCPDSPAASWNKFKGSGAPVSILIAAGFFLGAVAILMLREQVLPYRPGQTVSYDIISRADFTFQEKGLLAQKQIEARERAPRVYRSTWTGSWATPGRGWKSSCTRCPTR